MPDNSKSIRNRVAVDATGREKTLRNVHVDYEQQAIKTGRRETTELWSSLPDDLRESKRVAADHLLIKLAALGQKFRRSSESPAEPVEFNSITKSQARLLAEMEHNRWVAERLLASWRYAPEGKTENETKAIKKLKLNHNLISWYRLGGERKKVFDQVRTVLRECQKDRFRAEQITSEDV